MKKKGQNVAKGKAKKPVVKKVVKKAAAKKKAAPKKAAPKKKVAPKKKAAPKKTAAPKKKTATKKKIAAKVIATKVTAKPSAKKIDLSNFVTPLDDRVMVQVAEAEKMTAGGLYIPDSVTDVSGNLQGVVVSVGRGHRNKKGQVRPMDLKVGDKVLFSEYAGSKVKIQDQDLLIVRESDVLGVIG